MTMIMMPIHIGEIGCNGDFPTGDAMMGKIDFPTHREHVKLEGLTCCNSRPTDPTRGKQKTVSAVKKNVRFYLNADEKPITKVHSYQQDGTIEDIYWTRRELQAIRNELMTFVKDYPLEQPDYQTSLSDFLDLCKKKASPEQTAVPDDEHEVDLVNCLTQSPARGLESYLCASMRHRRRFAVKHLVGNQSPSSSNSDSYDEVLCAMSQVFSRHARKFALQIARGDARQAAIIYGGIALAA